MSTAFEDQAMAERVLELERELAAARADLKGSRTLQAGAAVEAHEIHFRDHPASQWDDNPAGFGGMMIRAESMDLVNDPRYFTSNVVDKRLAAFGKLSMVSAIMLATSFGQMFALKKNMNFAEREFGWVPMGWIQFIAFVIQMSVSFMCFLANYVVVHQTFYAHRLMTAGVHGFEQASMFYLSKGMCTWRHLAIRCLFNALWLYIVASGMLVFVKFFKDAHNANKGPVHVVILNPSVLSPPAPEHHPELDIEVHAILGGCLLFCFCCFACLLIRIRFDHLSCFQKHYHFAHTMTQTLMDQSFEMSHRAGTRIDN